MTLPGPMCSASDDTGNRACGECLALPAVLDMRQVRSLKASLEARLADTGPASIDAAAVKRISTGCIQILATFMIGMNATGRTVTLRQPSEAMVEAFADLGLGATLGHCNWEHRRCES